MPRSYFRTLPDLYERKAFGTDTHPPYPPAALACFVGVLCFGEQQPERGRFKSRRLLGVLLEGPHGEGRAMARQVGFLVKHGDLIERPDGSLYIEGWDELQEGNWQVVERMSRYRARRDGVTATVTVGVTDGTVTPQSRVVVEAVSGKQRALTAPAREGLPNLSPEAIEALEHATGRAVQVAGDRQLTEYDRLIEDHGLRAVVAAMDSVRNGQPMTARQVVWGAMKLLEPMPNAREADEAERAAEVERRNRRDLDRTQAYIAQMQSIGGEP